MTPMFTCMAARGPDSGGLAVFAETHADQTTHQRRRFSLFAGDRDYDWPALTAAIDECPIQPQGAGCRLTPHENHAVAILAAPPDQFRNWLSEFDPSIHILSVGSRIDVYKDEGDPAEIARRFDFAHLSGSHGVGHTRMATESAVTPVHSHPFTAGEDFCLVHNGSLSNPYMLQRKLRRAGLEFESDNDTEAACRYIEWRTRQGDTLEQAIEAGFRELDGFYTLLVGTADGITLVRDAFACKPAVVAETGEYVAVGSEYRALAHLPDVQQANIFEPKPEVIYTWQV